MYWPHMFPSSAILLALGFDYIAVQHRCLINYSPRDVLVVCWDLNRTSWPGGSSGRA